VEVEVPSVWHSAVISDNHSKTEIIKKQKSKGVTAGAFAAMWASTE